MRKVAFCYRKTLWNYQQGKLSMIFPRNVLGFSHGEGVAIMNNFIETDISMAVNKELPTLQESVIESPMYFLNANPVPLLRIPADMPDMR